MLNNLLSIEPSGLATSQGDFIFQDGANVSSWVVIHSGCFKDRLWDVTSLGGNFSFRHDKKKKNIDNE